MDYLDKLQKKCNISNKLMTHIETLFNKLLEFGYINRSAVRKLEKKLYNNINIVLEGNDVSLDYKTGYYDSLKKELYIKDVDNIESVYLRLIYALTTTEISKENYSVGYSTATMSSSNYKIIHKNFGINRAVVSNLVCRLLYTMPTTLSIVPTYRTYENDFLGNKITSDNDIYFLEGKLLQQLCYTFEISEENLYNHLFDNPKKYLNKFLNKTKMEDPDELLSLFDLVSRKYSNYNKLVFLNRELNNNYLEIKKHLLNSDISELERKQNKIKLAMRTALIPLHDNNSKNIDEFDTNIESVLAETINNLEDLLVLNISKIQNQFVNSLLLLDNKYAPIHYAIKLKELEKLLLLENPKLTNKLYSVITHDLTPYNEIEGSNLTEKIKFSLINEIISSEKYSKVYKNMKFKKLMDLPLEQNTALIALIVDDEFIQLVRLTDLDMNMRDLKNNTEAMHLTNMGYMLNNPLSTNDISRVEKIFTCIKNKGGIYNYITIDSMYVVTIDNITLVVVSQQNKFNVLKVIEEQGKISCENVKLSHEFSVFAGANDSNLPAVYDKKESTIKKMIAYILLILS